MDSRNEHHGRIALAQAVRAACAAAASSAYEDAGIRGLCEEGRWEAALAAVRRLDVESMVDALESD